MPKYEEALLPSQVITPNILNIYSRSRSLDGSMLVLSHTAENSWYKTQTQPLAFSNGKASKEPWGMGIALDVI